MIDIQNVMTAGSLATSSTQVSTDSLKSYLANLRRRHSWTNNSNNAPCHLQFYVLYPRRDIPASNISAISPPSSNIFSTGGFLGGGNSSPAMYAQDFFDQVIYAPTGALTSAGTKLTSTDPAATPYMATTLCSLFKIKPLRVSFPDGKKSAGVILPGQRVTYEGLYSKPLLCSWNKFGLNGNGAYSMATTWEVLRETPLIFMQMRGTTVHDTTTTSYVNYGTASLDYMQDFKFEVWRPTTFSAQTLRVTPTFTSVTTAENTNVMTGVVAPQTFS